MTASAPTRSRRRDGRLARDAAAHARIEAAVSMRVAGKSYSDIAVELGYADESVAYNAIWRELRSRTDASVEQLRQVEGERIRKLMAELERTIEDPGPLVSAGKVMDPVDRDVRTRAITAYAKVSDQYAKLYGMNVPVKTIIEVQRDEALNAKIHASIVVLQYRAQLEALQAGHVTVTLPDGVAPPELPAPARWQDEDDEVIDGIVVEDA